MLKLKKRYERYSSLIKQKVEKSIQKLQRKHFVHFLHIGKTGGTAIKYILKQQTYSNRFVVYLHPHTIKLRDVPQGESVMFFLRDPISRYVSGFYSRQRQNLPTFFSPWSPNEKIAFEYFDTPNQLATALFSEDVEERDRAEFAMKSIRHIRNSYWEWFENEAYFKSRASDIFFIGFQDYLAEDFEVLKEKLELPEQTQLPDDSIKAHKTPSNVNKNLEDKAIDNLKRWYEKEYRFINLCKEIFDDKVFPTRIRIK